jgi:hypothetical protein
MNEQHPTHAFEKNLRDQLGPRSDEERRKRTLDLIVLKEKQRQLIDAIEKIAAAPADAYDALGQILALIQTAKDDQADTSLRPREGETPEQTLDRVLKALR